MCSERARVPDPEDDGAAVAPGAHGPHPAQAPRAQHLQAAEPHRPDTEEDRQVLGISFTHFYLSIYSVKKP